MRAECARECAGSGDCRAAAKQVALVRVLGRDRRKLRSGWDLRASGAPDARTASCSTRLHAGPGSARRRAGKVAADWAAYVARNGAGPAAMWLCRRGERPWSSGSHRESGWALAWPFAATDLPDGLPERRSHPQAHQARRVRRPSPPPTTSGLCTSAFEGSLVSTWSRLQEKGNSVEKNRDLLRAPNPRSGLVAPIPCRSPRQARP